MFDTIDIQHYLNRNYNGEFMDNRKINKLLESIEKLEKSLKQVKNQVKKLKGTGGSFVHLDSKGNWLDLCDQVRIGTGQL